MEGFDEYMNAARNAHAAGDYDAARQLVAAARAAREKTESVRRVPSSFQEVGRDNAGGTVYKMPDGRYSYVSDGVSRTMDEIPSNLNLIAPEIKQEAGRAFDRAAVRQNPVAARAATALQGVPFVGEFMDEAVSAVSPQAGANMRAAQRGMAQENPGQTMALQVGGGIAGSLPMVAAAPAGLLTAGGQGLARRTLGAMGVGGLAGAIEGGVSQIGRNNEGPRLEGVAQSAALGGALGAGVGAIGEPLAQVGGLAYRKLGGGLARRLRGSQADLGLDDRASRIVADAAERDAPFAAKNIAAAGPDAVLADSGPNVQNLLDWAVNRPGGTSQVGAQVQDRANEAGRRLVSRLDDVFGEAAGPNAVQRNIMTASASARNDAYKAAYSSPIDYSSQKAARLEGLFDRVPEKAWRRANELMRTEGLKSGQIKINADTGEISSLPDVRQLDYLTRALRDMGDFGVGEGKEQGRAFMTLAKEIRTTLDDLVPAYKSARAAGQDAILNREAVNVGRDAFSARMTREDLADALDGMSKSEVGYVKSGVRSYVDDIMARTKVALTDSNMDAREAIRPIKDMLSREGKEKLTAILGEKQAEKFVKELREIYAPLAMRASVAQNSKTQIRANAEGMLREMTPSSFAEDLGEGRGLSGATANLAMRTANAGAGTRADRLTQSSEYIAQALMRPATAPRSNALATLGPTMGAVQRRQDEISSDILRYLTSLGLGAQQSPQGITQGQPR